MVRITNVLNRLSTTKRAGSSRTDFLLDGGNVAAELQNDGLGAAVCEYLSEACPVPVVRHGVNDEFGRSGKAPLVLEAYGITAEKIAECAKKAISLKK